MGGCRPKKDEISQKFIIEEPYGTVGAYPGATLILCTVNITYSSQDVLEKFRSFSLADSPSSSSSISSFTWIFRNVFLKHAETLFLERLVQEVQGLDDVRKGQRLEQEGQRREQEGQRLQQEGKTLDDVRKGQGLEWDGQRLQQEGQRLQREGNKVTNIDFKLIQNYAPCHECADKMIKYKETMESEGKEVSIKLQFANYYYWIGSSTNEKGNMNLAGLKKMKAKNIYLELLQGKECWETLFEDGDLVDLTKEDKEELREKAYSNKRREREADDRKIRDEKGLFLSSNAIFTRNL